MSEQTFDELTGHQQRALLRLHRIVADLGENDLMSLGGICHFLRSDLQGESVVFAEVLDTLKRLVVAAWLQRQGDPDADLDEVLTLISHDMQEYRNG
ncbi:hypothetical protein AB0D67_17200 [Streptosporangium sp. NPDC048047]|uniref:hypothetical protein n=1 Tax=Streptosporangium sp. NPDC048047 TaxID=3155748 RepID=UPI00343BEF0E